MKYVPAQCIFDFLIKYHRKGFAQSEEGHGEVKEKQPRVANYYNLTGTPFAFRYSLAWRIVYSR
jgi:hypothetical protein